VLTNNTSSLPVSRSAHFLQYGWGRRLFQLLTGTFCLYYVVRLVFYAFKIPHFIPPDEVTHVGYCLAFSKVIGFPLNTEATYQLGNLVDIPWFYYFMCGKLLTLNLLPISDLLFLRFVNIILTCSMVYCSYAWVSLITENKIAKLFFLILITNVPMLTFLGASVSYDNLVNLCAVLSMYCMQRFFLYRRPASFFLAGIAVFIGSLTKISFLPIALLVFSIIIVHERKRILLLPGYVRTLHSRLNKIEWGLAALFIVLFAMCIQLYGGNLLRYHKLLPAANQIMSEKQFMQQRILARDHIISQYKTGNWTYQRAIAAARMIRHPSDQRTALYVLKKLEENKEGNEQVMNPLEYSLHWSNTILSNFIGICAHRSMRKSAKEFTVYKWFFLFSFLIIVCYWRPASAGYIINQGLFVVVSYSIFLMFFHNYKIYLWSMSPDQGLQGRYVFPVLAFLLGIMVYYLSNYLKKWFVCLLFLPVSIFFIWGDFPYFQTHADVAWFTPLEDNIYYYQRAHSFEETGETALAIVEMRKAIELAPENGWYHRFLGDWLGKTGAQKEALEQYLIALSLKPQTAGFYYLAGKVNQEMGRFEQAVFFFSKAIFLEPDNVWYRRFLGDTYLRRGMIREAMAQYRSVLRLDPENVHCRIELSRLTDEKVF